MRVLWLILIALAVLPAIVAQAHPLDLGFVQVIPSRDALQTSIDLNPQIARALLGGVNPAKEADYRDLFGQTLEASVISLGSFPCTWVFKSGEEMEQATRIRGEAHCPHYEGQLHWSFPFLMSRKLPKTFQILIKVNDEENDHVYLVDRQKVDINFSVSGSAPSVGRFIQMGIEHIGATPSEWIGSSGLHLPDGIDHILFLVALILGGGTFLQLLGTATGFTVGHSITLALATTGLVRLPSRLVEASIAASIAFVAAESLFVKNPKHRWKMAAFFGLVHGFGFASAVTELHLTKASLLKALFGFNVGVEIGQAILLGIAAPVMFLATSNQRVKTYGVPACAVALFCIGSYWCVKRAMGVS
jgi:hypothetical protein